MRRRAARVLGAGTVGLAALAGSVLWAVPAQACSCASRDIDEELADGHALAIVTRTDKPPRYDAREGLPVGTFRVLDSAGPRIPKALEGELDDGGSCQPSVAPGALAALIYERKDGAWDLGSCAKVELGQAVQRAQGDPVASKGGPAVAYAAGSYGSSRLVALDRLGNAVAWDQTPGDGDLVAVCPGGETVVAIGRTPRERVERVVRQQGPPYYEKQVTALTVHEVTSLRVLRTVNLGQSFFEHHTALRCGDRDGKDVQVLSRNGSDEDTANLLTVRDGKVESVNVGRTPAVLPVDEGFLVLDEDRSGGVSLALVRPDGKRTTIATVPDMPEANPFAVSAGGRTVALYGYRAEPRGHTIVTVDADSGKRLGEWTRDRLEVGGLGWTASGELLVREARSEGERTSNVLAFDRTLTQRGTWPSVEHEWPVRFTAVGDSAVLYGYGSRPTAIPREGERVVAESLRLAATEHLVAVDGAGFGGDADPSEAASEPVTMSDEPSLDAGLLTALAGGAAVAGIAAATVVGRRRSPRS